MFYIEFNGLYVEFTTYRDAEIYAVLNGINGEYIYID
jgi:hypothetical protein